MNWLYYLAEANLYLGVLYLAYCLFLSRDTHYQLNRAYLLFSCIVSFILPVLQAGALKPTAPAEPVSAVTYNAVPVQAVRIITLEPQKLQPASAPVVAQHLTLQGGLWYTYLGGAAVSIFILFIKMYALLRLARNAQSVKEGKYRVFYLTGTDAAFSFFNCLFIGADATGTDTIMRHELVHIRQKHSVDMVFIELFRIINWFNPFVYLVQNSLKTVHEYIADEQTAAYETDALTYSSFLVNSAFGAGGSSLTHSFFNNNLVKKRIIMLNQQRSGSLAKLKYLVAIPICAALLCASTLVFSKTYGWVDLAPANVKPSGKYDILSTNLTPKRKRLEITQNRVASIADGFSTGQKNEKTVYTAGTIKGIDRSLLLKENYIKEGAIRDSTLFTTKDGKLVLPVVNVDGYYPLDHFLHNNIHYSTTKGDKGGLVEVGFTLDNDRHITNARIVKSGGANLDALALNGFNSYKGIVNDDAGRNYKIGVYFFTNDYSIFKTDSLGKDPEFAGELIITNYKYPVNVTNKGYEYDESGTGFPGDNTNMSQAKVVIYDKNGEANWYYQRKCTPADLKLLKDKYGYAFPTSSSLIVQFLYPRDIKTKHLAYIFDVASYLAAPYANQFYNYMADNIEYPQQAKKALAGGAVMLSFNLDNNGMIRDVKVAKSAGKGFDEAAVKALQSYKSAINDNAGKHSIAVLFCVAENKYRPVVSENTRKEGYVGELAVSDAKSPIINGSAKYTPPAGTPGNPKTGIN